MAAEKSTPARHDKEIDALLNRLHSGCRLVDFEDVNNRAKGRDADAAHVICNQLRNASPPDEVHAELGRALAHSYVQSLLSISLKEQSSTNEEMIRASGERIIQSLCCGEDAAKSSGRESTTPLSGRAYASVACAFFGYLQSFFINNRDQDDSIKACILLKIQWRRWCIRCEEMIFLRGDVPFSDGKGGGIHVLNACLKGYGYISHFDKQFTGSHSDDAEECGCGCAKVYETLVQKSSRKYLIRTCVDHSVSLMQQSSNVGLGNDFVGILSPLFHKCVLVARKGTTQTYYHEERQLILQEILRGCGTLLRHDNLMAMSEAHGKNSSLIDQIGDMIHYLTKSLTSYLDQSIHAAFTKVTSSDHQNEQTNLNDIFELSYDWLRGICDLMTNSLSMKVKSDASANAVCISMKEILATILPQFTPSINSMMTTFDMAPIYVSLVSSVSLLPQEMLLPMANASIALRLGSLALNLHDDLQIKLMVDLMLALWKCLEGTSDVDAGMMMLGGISSALGRVLCCRPTCCESATELNKLGGILLQRSQSLRQNQRNECDGVHLMDIIACSLNGKELQPLIHIISDSISTDSGLSSTAINCWQRRPLPVSDQCSGLLLGVSLLHISIISPETMAPSHAFEFLQAFLRCYPRLATRAAPSVIDVARACLSSSFPQTQTLLASLEFLSSPCIVSDPHGAHLAWTFFSSLVEEGVPTSVRSIILRLLPQMCSSNKRLFRRARDVIGRSMVAQDPIIRSSATAALAELANLDLLRDVEQILGWVQNRLTDDESSVVYYGLEVLRYLVVNEELEFDLVVRVLEKRLNVDLSNIDEVLGLDVLAFEGLVALMGEGGLEESDEESDQDESGDPTVSPQTIKAVALLVELALLPQLSIKDGIGREEDSAFVSNIRIQRRIYISLASYSAVILGLDQESIRSWDGTHSLADGSEEIDPDITRFLSLKEIVLAGLDVSTKLCCDKIPMGDLDEIRKQAEVLGRTLLKFEEDVHGSFLFRNDSSSGRGSSGKSSRGKTESRSHVSKSVLSSLPTASSIQDMFESDPRSASATAVLFSLSSESDDVSLETDDILMQITECFGDIANEPIVDPAFLAMQISSLICSMNIVWKSIARAPDNIREESLDQVVSQIEEWSETYGEYAFVAMAALILAVDDSAQCWASVTKMQSTILDGKDNYLFESEDLKLICLGIVAARLARAGDARVTGLIDLIEQSLSEHSGQTCFGGIFGLGIIASSVAGSIHGTDPSDTWRRQQAQRIVCILFSELDSGLEDDNEVIHGLISYIKSGGASNEPSQSCSGLDSFYIQDQSIQKMKGVLISLSHILPVLRSVSDDLLKCVLLLLEKLPWGSGKGFILYSAYKNALVSGVIEQGVLSEAISTISSDIQDQSSGVGDALLSLASLCHLSSEKVQQELDLVTDMAQKVLQDRDSHVGGEDQVMSILACCATIGELPGIGSFAPNIHAGVKKNFLAGVVTILEEIATNDAEELKLRDASTIGLGILCAMNRAQTRNKEQKKSDGMKLDNIQGKEGSTMQLVLLEIQKSYSLLCEASSNHDACRASAMKLCALFSMLEPIAMPGNFSRVIELTLNGSPINDVELKTSSIELLVSQLEPFHRRIGFDGRGFTDLSTRLAKIPSDDLHTLMGSKAISILMSSLPNLLHQLPTGVGEEVAKCFWAVCRDDLKRSASPQSMINYMIALKTILGTENQQREGRPAPKKFMSPALFRNLQKFTVTEIFSDICAEAVPSDHINTTHVWSSYLQCIKHVPSAIMSDTDGLNGGIDHGTVFGMASCASLSLKSTRKVESWIARQELKGVPVILLSILAVATRAQNENEMKESILGLFEVMIVTGIDTMSSYLLAAKVAYWWDSQEFSKLEYIDISTQRVSNMSSFLISKDLRFDVSSMAPHLLIRLFDSFIADLPPKLAVLCKIWKISDDVSNRATRILSASLQKREKSDYIKNLRDIIRLLEGGQIDKV